MRYLPRLSLSVWALLALLAGGSVACLSPAWSADQKPLVVNPTTGRTEQMQTGNNLLIPGTSTLTVSSLTSGRIPYSSTAGLVVDSANLQFGSNASVVSLRTAPHTWGSNYSAVEFRGSALSEYYAAGNIQSGWLGNLYDNGVGTFKFTENGAAAAFRMFPQSQLFIWFTTATGTAGAAATLDEKMRLDANALKVTGNIVMGTAGNGLAIKEGTNAKMGAATLAAGTVTVNTTAVTANSRIYLTSQVDGGTVGFQRISARTAATSFTITSSSVLDTSTVAWMIVEPAP